MFHELSTLTSALSTKRRGEFSKAAKLFYRAGNMAFKNKKYEEALSCYCDAANCTEMPSICRKQEMSKLAMKSYRKAITCSQKAHRKKAEVNISIDAAHFYLDIGNIQKAKVLFKKAYSLCRDEKKLWFIEYAALCAERLGMIDLEKEFFEESAALYIRAAKLSKDANNKYRYYHMAAVTLENIHELQEAITYHTIALEYVLQNTPRILFIDPTQALLAIFRLLGKKDPGKTLELSLKVAKKIDISRGDCYHNILYGICRLTNDENIFKEYFSKLVAFAENQSMHRIVERAEAAWLLEDFDKERSLNIINDIVERAKKAGYEEVAGTCYLILSETDTANEKELLETGLNFMDYCIQTKYFGGYLALDAYYHRMKSRYFLLKALEADPEGKITFIGEAIAHLNKAFLELPTWISYSMRGHGYIYEAFRLCILGRRKRDETLVQNAISYLNYAEKIFCETPEIDLLNNASQALIKTLQSINSPHAYEDYRERAEHFIQEACRNLRSVGDHPLRKLFTRELRTTQIFVKSSLEHRLSREQQDLGREIFEEIKVTQRMLKTDISSLQKLIEEIVAKLPERKKARKKLKDHLVMLVKGVATTSDLIGMTNILLEISGNPSVSTLSKEAIKLIMQALI